MGCCLCAYIGQQHEHGTRAQKGATRIPAMLPKMTCTGRSPTFLVDSSQVACASASSVPGMPTAASGTSTRISSHACACMHGFQQGQGIMKNA